MEGLNSTILASIGFLIIWICYFGVNLRKLGFYYVGSILTP